MSNIAQTYKRLRSSQRFQKRFGVAIRLIIAVILIAFSIFPVLWIVSASLITQTRWQPKA